MKELKGSTKQGQRVVEMYKQFIGYDLDDVYGHYSKAKAAAMAECKAEFNMRKGLNFHICSRNVNRFTVGWFCVIDGENVVMVRTGLTDYLVWLDR